MIKLELSWTFSEKVEVGVSWGAGKDRSKEYS